LRESTESWADLLRSCKRCGMRAPVLAVGDGALGFWAALRDVFPATRERRCWFRKIANVLNALPMGPGSRAAGVAMAFKLIKSAQARWRAVNAPHLVALVRAGARFEKGILIERPDESAEGTGGDQQVA
jgi:transposase-like protein